jgi:hypothetical protein
MLKGPIEPRFDWMALMHLSDCQLIQRRSGHVEKHHEHPCAAGDG